ncbi:hypothetical protein QN277_005076 [Acacia crassicarpa]|uniref:Erythronate-4-phosphate dehydrogenase family protein n=2 Tax=Acacia crassicarpa TaxID=499986 RepID=A0AAE1JW26_9FABA|nr:hypothetical protein QN277_005076 [Acacia crassicarpa]
MMEDYRKANGNGAIDNGHIAARHSYQPSMKGSLPWLDIRVFYVRVCKCELDDTTPEVLTLNHIPLNPDTLLEVNGVRTSIYSDGVSTLLKRDRVDRRSEEVTFVSTDSIRTSGSVKYEVFDNDVLLLSGVLDLCNDNKGLERDLSLDGKRWIMNCESDLTPGASFFRGEQFMSPDSASPTIEVYIAGSFLGTPIILTKTLRLNSQKKVMRKGGLDAIPEHEADENQKHVPSSLALQMQGQDYLQQKSEDEDYYSGLYTRTGYQEEMEDGELSWFNAGVRVGVGIGLSVCLGIGIGVGLLMKTYQGTTRHLRRRFL